MDIPKELAALRTRWTSLRESEFWEDILVRVQGISDKYHRDTLERGIRKADAQLRAEQLPFHFSHGDFTPWNTKYDGNRLYVFDWEQSKEAGLPAHDVFHFHFQEMRCVMRRDVEKIYDAFLTHQLLRSRVETHLRDLGLTGIPVEVLFFLYRLDQLANEVVDPRAYARLSRELATFEKLLDAI